MLYGKSDLSFVIDHLSFFILRSGPAPLFLRSRMKRLKNWWNKWGVVDVLTLGGGVAATIGYIAYFTRPEDIRSALLNLWPNIATEILGVWLSVRIIGAIIDNRQERRNVRNMLAGNLNFLLGICQRLAPRFYSFHLIDLQNEIMFYTDRKRLKSPVFKKYFSRQEREVTDNAFGHAQTILEQGRVAGTTIQEGFEVEFPAKLLAANPALAALKEAFDEYRRSESADPKELENALNVFPSDIKSPPMSQSEIDLVNTFRLTIETHLGARKAFSKALLDLETDVRAFREIVWAEFS
jgi:hypothetical protein